MTDEQQAGAHHCTPEAIQALIADLEAIGECREYPPLRDRDHRARAAVVLCVIKHFQQFGVRLATEKFELKAALRAAVKNLPPEIREDVTLHGLPDTSKFNGEYCNDLADMRAGWGLL